MQDELLGFPDSNRSIGTAGGKEPTVGTETYTGNVVLVLPNLFEELAANVVPNPGDRIRPGGHEHRPVWAKCKSGDSPFVCDKVEQLFGRTNLEDRGRP